MPAARPCQVQAHTLPRALDIILAEMDTTMALTGERDIANVGPHNIYSNDLLRRIS